MGALDGRTAVITGAAGGLGREYTRLFLEEGARVVATDLAGSGDGESGRSALEEIFAEFVGTGRLIVQFGDVAVEGTAEDVISTAIDLGGQLDVLVNNAGNFIEGPFTEFDVDDFDALLRVHVRGSFLMSRAAARHWRARSESGETFDASLINTTSRSALKSIQEHAAYAAAKSAVATFTSTLAKELNAYGVRANCIAPFARTPMTQGVKVLTDTLREAGAPGQFDPFSPANVAPLVAYLATSDCPLNGELFYVHGGEVARYSPWQIDAQMIQEHRFSIDELARDLPKLCGGVVPYGAPDETSR